jgi:hypothetical protein
MYSVNDCIKLASGWGGAFAGLPDGDERRAIIHSSELLNKIVSKYFSPERYLRQHPNVANMFISAKSIQKASEQMKKINEARDNEIHTFIETGEISLGFKDLDLHERVKMLEDKNKEQATVIVNLNSMISRIEKESSDHRDQMLAIQHLLESQIEQKNSEIREAQEAQEVQEVQEVQEATKEKEYKKKMLELYDNFICIFLPGVALVLSMMIYALSRDSTNSFYFPENRTLIMDRSS